MRTNIMNRKAKVVDAIPGTDKAPKGTYGRFWTDLKNTPKGKFLEVPGTNKEQHLISHHIYYKARKAHKKVSIAFKPKAMYIYWTR